MCYVLSQNGNGYGAADFSLDVYTPAGEHLFFQRGPVAAGLAVDLWRNVYTLNFQQIAGPGGRTEPSISEYAVNSKSRSRLTRKRKWRWTRRNAQRGKSGCQWAAIPAIARCMPSIMTTAKSALPTDRNHGARDIRSGTSWNIFDLGGGNIAVGVSVSDYFNNEISMYWNSCDQAQSGSTTPACSCGSLKEAFIPRVSGPNKLSS